MIVGMPAGELLLLAGLVIVGAVVTGMLAGLFGIGGGALIVPVLYEIFGAFGVPEQVRFQLCVGTSIAIIVPTNVQSLRVHRDKGAVMAEVVRAWSGAGGGGSCGRLGDCGLCLRRGAQDSVRGGRRRHRGQAPVRP